MSQSDILNVLKQHPEGLTIRDLEKIFSDLSIYTIRKSMGRLRAHGEVQMIAIDRNEPDPRGIDPLPRKNELNLYYAKE